MTIPERIGKYAISAVLGKGSMGTVYKGFDPHIDRVVAIKTVHKELLGDSTAIDSVAARFRNEAKAVGRVMHPGVVAIYEFGEDDSTAYIAMEFVDGRSLDDVLADTPMLTEAQVLRIMDQLLDALSAAHAQGVWHRDIKPANLILARSGQVKLTDFGVARIADANLTQASSMIGTPAYMAPEQFVGEGIDHRADLFACGVVLYRLLTGRRAFSGATEVVMYKILNEQPPAPSEVTQGLRPAAYDAVVARAMAKRADQRYQSAQAMRQALQDAARGIVEAPRQAPDPQADILTVIREPGAWTTPGTGPAAPAPVDAPPPAAADRSGVSASSATSTSMAMALAGWDPQELARVERALARHVGPMAKVMVRQAARGGGDVAALADTVSRHVADDARRRQFLDEVLGGSQVRPAGSGVRPAAAPEPATATAAPAPVAALADPLTEEFKAQALQVLTRRMGPIARVMVRRAAEQCGGAKGRFVQLLVDGASEAERPALQKDLAALG